MRVGFANGCFDLLHEGHLHFLQEASKHCDYLIVAVNTDRSVTRLKGPGRPVEDLHTRMHNIIARADAYVDAVICFEGRVEKLLMEIRPQVLFKGYDHQHGGTAYIRVPGWKDKMGWDMIDIVQIGHLPGFSTTGALA
jgi:D-beta-D-heptose 7-phosphate kinase/D-beta-D-heptose 1-phosphate adenosyltransferase